MNATITRQCAEGLHGFCKEDRATCACTGCHLGPCSECGADNLQKMYDGLCASCKRGLANRKANGYTPCDNDPRHGRGFRNPGTRKNEFFCRGCHAKTGASVPMRQPDVRAIAGCVTEDIASEQHQWTWIKGNKFGCVCGARKYDAKLRKEMRS